MSTEIVSIQPLSLLPNQTYDFEVLVWDDSLRRAVSLIDKNQMISRDQFESIVCRPGQRCFVRQEHHSEYRDYITDGMAHLAESQLAKIQRFAFSIEFLRMAFVEAVSSISLNRWVGTTIELAEKVQSGSVSIDAGRDIVKVLPQSDSFVSHSFNTGIYCYLIAKRLGLSSEQIADCMVGGFLHDAGKMEQSDESPDRVWPPTGLLHCNSTKESPAHMTQGLLRLSWHPQMRQAPLFAVYQHHERQDGRGGPVGLAGQEIPIVSRVCAVANRWDGLLSDRRGRRGATTVAATAIMESESGSFWDKEVVSCLLEVLKQNSKVS
jgi:HD-GYP domain-containing protein (c-di-GMP phosphodiesterase class II)